MSKSLAKRIAELCIKETFPDEGKNGEKKIPDKVVEFHQPSELEAILKLELELSENGISQSEFLALCQKFMAYSCKTWSPKFMTQLVSGIDAHALCASWVLESLNGSSFTYEAAPVFTLIQRAVIDNVLARFSMSRESGDGVFCPGASLGNMYALMLARQKRFPSVKNSGTHGLPPLAIFTSDVSHYSIEKGAIFLGFGLDSLVKVKTDEAGCMIADHLRDAIKLAITSGRVPLLVNATAGTTMLGSFDNLEALAAVCAEFEAQTWKIWLHCDAAYGGSAILSQRTAHLLKGSHQCDSITLDFHKVAGSLLQCSLLITKYGSLLPEAISTSAGYLFQSDKGYDVGYDSGDKSIQCSQKADAFKWWLLWKAKGTLGIEREINSFVNLSQFTQQKIVALAGEGFQLVIPAFQWLNICFWYIPTWMRDSCKSSILSNPLLGKIAPKVRKRLRETGQLLINCASHKTLPNYFRIVCTNGLLEESDIMAILELIRSTAEQMDQTEFN